MAAMKCPKCRRAMAFDAVSHECGWQAIVSRPPMPEEPPAQREDARGYIERIREMLAQRRRLSESEREIANEEREE